MTDKLIGIAWNEWLPYYRSYIPNLHLYRPGEDLSKFDLMIFPGGSDVNPVVYGESNVSSSFNSTRDSVEIHVLNKCLELGTKILGICRGHQLINAVLGGKLIQDLYHDSSHDITWTAPGGPMELFFPFHVNSIHHQGYTWKEVSPKLTPLAIEPETGVIEVSSNFKNIISVQFHPEIMGAASGPFFSWITKEFLK